MHGQFSQSHALPSSCNLSFQLKMMLCPKVDVEMLARVQPKVIAGMDYSPQRWWNIPSPLYGFHGVSQTEHTRSACATNIGFVTLRAISSKKERGTGHKTKDFDNDGHLLTEEELNYKPLGFGQGKTYDTSLEEKLLEQIELAKALQESALSSSKTKVAPKKHVAQPRTQTGIKVWVTALPKKRNIDRDLRSAFRHVRGLVNISPSVHGNDKTRDPVCKGSASLMFDTIDHAQSFISSFQGQPIRFGKVEKQVSFSFREVSGAEDLSFSGNMKGMFQASKLKVRDKEAAAVIIGAQTRHKSANLSSSVDSKPNRELMESFQPQVDVMQDRKGICADQELGETIEERDSEHDEIMVEASEEDDHNETTAGEAEHNETREEEIESEYDSELDDEPEEVTMSVEIEVVSPDTAAIGSAPHRVEEKSLNEAELHIEELEERLRKRLAAGDPETQKQAGKAARKPRGFSSKKSKSARQSSSRGNNIAAVTHGLRRREREVMTGVLERYGRNPSSTTKS